MSLVYDETYAEYAEWQMRREEHYDRTLWNLILGWGGALIIGGAIWYGFIKLCIYGPHIVNHWCHALDAVVKAAF